MYLISVVLLMLIFPIASIAVDALAFHGAVDFIGLVGKWFVFWAVGMRLFIAGVRQVTQPQFTAETIFTLEDRRSYAIVRELGFANLSMGVLGLWSLVAPSWVAPAAIVGGLYYGFAGLGHIVRRQRNLHEQTALISDLLIFLLLAVFVAIRRF